ncbi:TraB/GumN family protein [Halosimplex sp. J119]
MPDEPPTDPRLESEYVETYGDESGHGSVTLVGVVHDHPASVYRVRHIVEREAPAVLAVELPPLAVPLYEAYASDERTPPAFGGEMAAAIQAAETDTTVGIDGPSASFCRRLARTLVGERASLETAMRSVRGVASVGKTTLACRAAATLTNHTGLRIAVGDPTSHEVAHSDSPQRQVEDENRQIRTATAVLDALESPPASRLRSETREAHMADRLRDLRARGDVVAVIGLGHFEPIRDRLTN